MIEIQIEDRRKGEIYVHWYAKHEDIPMYLTQPA
jgi:hypothetical protein